jgi:RNA-directed DNA polymerase
MSLPDHADHADHAEYVLIAGRLGCEPNINIYMRRFVKGWKTGGYEKRLAARIVNYADDFVNCCKGTADEAMTVMRGMMSRLKLTVNETKTRLCHLPDDSFDFLGYTLGRNYDSRTDKSYLGPKQA